MPKRVFLPEIPAVCTGVTATTKGKVMSSMTVTDEETGEQLTFKSAGQYPVGPLRLAPRVVQEAATDPAKRAARKPRADAPAESPQP